MKTGKRILSLLFTLIITLVNFSGLISSVSAESQKMTVYIIDLPRGSDPSDRSSWGHPALNFMGGWSVNEQSDFYSVHCQDTFDGRVAYCIEPGFHVESGDSYTGFNESFWDNYPSNLNQTINPRYIKLYIGRIMQYGWQGNGNTDWNSANHSDAKEISSYIASQLLIWETVVGERDENFNKIDATKYGKNNVKEYIKKSHPLFDSIFKEYSDIENKVQNHTKLPSFFRKSIGTAEIYELKWNGSNYSVTLTDTNGVLGNYKLSSNSKDIKLSIDGNKLTISCTEAPKDIINITAEKNNGKRKGIVVWSDGHIKEGLQNLATYGAEVSDPVSGYLKLEVKTGNLHLIKTSEDGIVGGITFKISGNGYTASKTTNSKGIIDATDLEPGEYTITEQSIDKYRPQSSKKVTIVSGQTASVSFENTLKKGRIALIKHTGNGETGIQKPEFGAEFDIYIKSSGSYDNADKTQRDHLICDDNGYAQSKELPYGTYIVSQVGGWDGTEFIDDFEVFISKDNQTYRYILNNASFRSYLKIIKTDAETGKTIPYAGAGFQLFGPDGNKITQSFTYPEITEVDTFYTNSEGYLITPEQLEYGTGYYLVEVCAPYGYVLDTEPVYFDITEENSSVEGDITVTAVKKSDKAQKGVIRITKTGEIFSSVTENEDVYQPVYTVSGLEGAEFDIIAKEDIYTPDGTLRYTAGETADKIITDKSGAAASKELYLGKYEVKEIKAPDGMILSKETYDAELSYAGQEVEITEFKTEIYNERQKAEILINKALEQDESFGIGMNGEINSVVFGLYAGEVITAADGSVIPSDGLLEIAAVTENGSMKFATELPFGNFYLKELATDEHYVISDEKYEFSFEYGGQDNAVIEIKANEGNVIINNLKRGRINGSKVDESENTLSGALIGLFAPDCTDFTENNAVMIDESGEDGSFSFTDIPFGKWIIKEIAQPEGYILSSESYPVFVQDNAEVIEIKIINKQIRGNLRLVKTDADLSDIKLSGAVFEVYSDINGDKRFDKSDKLLGVMEETSEGIYEMKDIAYGGVFVKEKSAPDGYTADDNAYYVFIDTDGKTYEVKNKDGDGFANTVMKGSLKIVKTTSDGKKEGFAFRVTGPNGYDETFTTDANGKILIENLRIGEYIVTELKNDVSSSYKIAGPVTVEIIPDETLLINVHNDKITVEGPPKTGDERNMKPAVFILAISSLALMSSLLIRKNGKRKKVSKNTEVI